MVMAKRIFLFIVTNILVLATISIVWAIVSNYFGISIGRTGSGLSYGPLMIYCLIWGFAGSFISLALSRVMAKWTMGVQLIDVERAQGFEAALVEKVTRLSRTAGLNVVPQIGIYESPELNAFATGPTRNRALVAVSTGLLQRMSNEEVEGVLAHEIAHVANGDMVTLTLIQGVVNSFVLFFAKIIGFFVGQTVKEESRAAVEFGVSLAAQLVLGILGSIVVNYFSRWREFRADAGGARFAGKNSMVAALQRLRANYETTEPDGSSAIAAFKISSRGSGFLSLFSTHPSLEDRIARLQQSA